MSRFFALLFFAIHIFRAKCDYTKFDYCSIDCKTNTHSACKCDLKSDGRKYIEDNMAEFREQVVDLHNKYRELVASGKATEASGDTPGNPKATSAADMRVMRYDMEMEHIIGCYLKSKYKKVEHDCDCCRTSEDKSPIGQNLFFTTDDTATALDAIKPWYDEIKIYPHEINDFKSGVWGHWSQLIWAETDRVGCARIHWKHHDADMNKNFSYVIGCDYKLGGNVQALPIYKQGKPCSACPDNMKCQSKKYPSLCGSDPVMPDSGSSTPSGEGGKGGGDEGKDNSTGSGSGPGTSFETGEPEGTSNGIRNKNIAVFVGASVVFSLMRHLFI